MAKSQKLSQRATVTVTPGKFTSRATGQICDNCNDFCRRFEMMVDRDDGFSQMTYSGQKCIGIASTDPTRGPWNYVQPLTLSRSFSRVDPDVLSELRQSLSRLLYLPAADTADPYRVMSALDAFRTDARIVAPSTMSVTSGDLALLRSAVSSLDQVASCKPPRSRAIACGRAGRAQ